MQRNASTFRRRGASVLEAAIVLPVLLMLVFGGIEWCLYVYAGHAVHGAAREGARAGILPGNGQAEVDAVVAAAMNRAGFDTGQYTLRTYVGATQASPATANPGDFVKVTVELEGSAVGVDLWGAITGDKTVTASAAMRREG